jgi:hypothetical protein
MRRPNREFANDIVPIRQAAPDEHGWDAAEECYDPEHLITATEGLVPVVDDGDEVLVELNRWLQEVDPEIAEAEEISCDWAENVEATIDPMPADFEDGEREKLNRRLWEVEPTVALCEKMSEDGAADVERISAAIPAELAARADSNFSSAQKANREFALARQYFTNKHKLLGEPDPNAGRSLDIMKSRIHWLGLQADCAGVCDPWPTLVGENREDAES